MHEQDAPIRLPALRRAEQRPERILYVARAGFGALPSGSGTILVFMMPQLLSLGFLVWAIWWPYPASMHAFVRAILCSIVLAGAVVTVAAMLIRRNRGFISAVVQAPFISITVTDRRMLWTVPWEKQPLIEIGRRRMLRGVLGSVDRRGRGNAAVELVAGDPAADIDGHIHFDRLPQVARFVGAIESW
ncbi:hypothetical protein Q4F19_19685 [Sphingomonas sp. BIUV-7]|uniref:PH domain-containing protein n=1 Tax=Sphingomonas natans TaxID=3063330 RepID=A0ABT8YE11_9SPHN|nr:hypothetical protein [Sphingomonas sp. BIUV-7]MDO6416615.1 hypothetical protein [Sphingomonas sp. BIUV-7]